MAAAGSEPAPSRDKPWVDSIVANFCSGLCFVLSVCCLLQAEKSESDREKLLGGVGKKKEQLGV